MNLLALFIMMACFGINATNWVHGDETFLTKFFTFYGLLGMILFYYQINQEKTNGKS